MKKKKKHTLNIMKDFWDMGRRGWRHSQGDISQKVLTSGYTEASTIFNVNICFFN